MSDDIDQNQRRPANRSAKIADRVIELTHEEPLERLKQFCSQGYYRFHFNWDKFANGVMCELEITYQLGVSQVSRRTLTKESRFVHTDDIDYAKKVIAAILLQRLGLGVPHPEEDETDEKMKEMATKSIDFAMSALNGMLSSVATANL